MAEPTATAATATAATAATATATANAAVSSPALLLHEDAVTNNVTQVVVHPLVLVSILDHHSRRQGDGRVIGTLLGQRDGNVVEVTNSFAVPHAERGDEVAIGKDFNKQMFALHLQSNKKEVVVGWYASASSTSSSDTIVDTSSLVHEFYSGECEDGDPVHLVLDTRLVEDALSIRAYKSTPVQVQGEPLANLFHEVRLSQRSTESESICLDQMAKQLHDNTTTNNTTPPLPKDDTKLGLQLSMEKLLAMLEQTSEYVDKVVDGTTVSDQKVGRQMADALATVPRIRPQVFDRLFNDSLQDLLMVTYLSNITRTQLTIAEKLNASLAV